jgi:2-oxo-4-hydroxy-4-carboxy-5-ureidoimidazoline decarboxylase
MRRPKIPLRRLNALHRDRFVAIVGPFVEKSPWIADRIFPRRPFGSVDELHQTIVDELRRASREEQIGVINEHPDLVGKAAQAGTLTDESKHEQASAGLGDLSPQEIDAFNRYNVDYRARFGFPFVICARENKKDAILAAFPIRLRNTREQEIDTAITEITKIANLRLRDAVAEE